MIYSCMLGLSGLAICIGLAAQGQSLTTLYRFPDGAAGSIPSALMVEDGKIYGVEHAASSYIFDLNIHTDREATIHQFQPDEGTGNSPLLELSGYLYGTSANGGGGYGNIYRVDPTTGELTILYTFMGGNDGAYPVGGLTYANGVLYGTTSGGGPGQAGTVFSYDLDTGVETVLASFNNGAFGGYPYWGVIYKHGILYGANISGGNSRCRCGTIFSVNPITRKRRLLHAFLQKDGAQPFAPLLDLGSSLYGTTQFGGAYGGGTLFVVNAITGAEVVLHNFGLGIDGSSPQGELIDYAGEIYGATFNGGSKGYGIVFKIDPKTGVESVVYSFTGQADGGGPSAGVTEKGGLIFGTTSYRGGPNATGTIFEITP